MPCFCLGETKELQRRRRRFEGDDRRFAFGRRWKELEARCSNNSKRTFRANKEIAQVVPGVVLFESPQSMRDAAVGKNGFEPKRQIACISVGEDGRAAGVCSKHAADLCAAFGCETQRKETAGFFRRVLGFEQRDTGFDDHRAAGRIDVAYFLEARERKHDFVAVERWNLSADKAGIATLRNDADVFAMSKRKNTRDFIR